MLLIMPYLALRQSAIMLISNETHRSLLVHSSKPYQLYQAKNGCLCEELLYFVKLYGERTRLLPFYVTLKVH
jgi:hypothetical protein